MQRHIMGDQNTDGRTSIFARRTDDLSYHLEI